MVIVEASSLIHSPDDLVEKGEDLGLFRGCLVAAPFRARIESISFDSDEHALRVVLTEAP